MKWIIIYYSRWLHRWCEMHRFNDCLFFFYPSLEFVFVKTTTWLKNRVASVTYRKQLLVKLSISSKTFSETGTIWYRHHPIIWYAPQLKMIMMSADNSVFMLCHDPFHPSQCNWLTELNWTEVTSMFASLNLIMMKGDTLIPNFEKLDDVKQWNRSSMRWLICFIQLPSFE